MMIGVWGRILRIPGMVSRPFISGISMSSRMTSGRSVCSLDRARRPLLAQPAIRRSGSLESTSVSTFRTTRESSTIMIWIGGIAVTAMRIVLGRIRWSEQNGTDYLRGAVPAAPVGSAVAAHPELLDQAAELSGHLRQLVRRLHRFVRAR